MKIVHMCLGEHYVDGYGYQENCLTKMHKQLGHEVFILASTETYIKQKRTYLKPSEYSNEYGIPVTRIPYVSWLPHKIAIKLRYYQGIYNYLKSKEPDIIFIHSGCFLGMKEVVKYVKTHPVRVYVDSHTDYVNSGKNWLSMNVLHKVLYRHAHQSILPYTKKFYGTLPIRNVYLNEIYKIPKGKIEYLPMGIDLSDIKMSERESLRAQMRKKYGIKDTDFVVVTGGKLEKRKNTIELINAFSIFPNSDVKLFLFGSVSDNIKEEFDRCLNSLKDRVTYAGWAKWDEIYKYVFVGDLAVFPGTHSAIWEQTVGLGIPCIFKYMENITQIDLGGNCDFLNDSSAEEISSKIAYYYIHRDALNKMKDNAEDKGPKYFSYLEIARRAIEC